MQERYRDLVTKLSLFDDLIITKLSQAFSVLKIPLTCNNEGSLIDQFIITINGISDISVVYLFSPCCWLGKSF